MDVFMADLGVIATSNKKTRERAGRGGMSNLSLSDDSDVQSGGLPTFQLRVVSDSSRANWQAGQARHWAAGSFDAGSLLGRYGGTEVRQVKSGRPVMSGLVIWRGKVAGLGRSKRCSDWVALPRSVADIVPHRTAAHSSLVLRTCLPPTITLYER